MELFKRKPNHNCLICNKEVYRRPSQVLKNKGKVYCSLECAQVRNKKPHQCTVCKNEFLGRRNAVTCSRSCSNKNRTGTSYKLGRPRDKAAKIQTIRLELLLERGNKCNRCDFSVVEILQIHHIVEKCNGGTDDKENLEVLCPNCHMLHHFLKKKNDN